MNSHEKIGGGMDLVSFIEGSLLRIVFGVFCIVVLLRIVFFIASIVKNRHQIKESGGNVFIVFARFFIPFHRAVPKKPFYASLRYIFHICLFVVPIWLAGHISLWEESSLEWSWASIPDELADWMTLVLLALAVFFIVRHFTVKAVRANTFVSDYVIIVITALPFATGYFLAHGTLDNIPFFGDYIGTIHILSGEIMIISAALLFCRTRMNVLKCTGCASCVLSCPTCTLESEDSGEQRIFHYSLYQCICCGSCVYTCPEDAAELRHEISLKNFSRIFIKEEIQSVELESCKRCGALFVPEPLMGKIQKTFKDEYLEYCPNCRKINIGDYFKHLSSYHRRNVHINSS